MEKRNLLHIILLLILFVGCTDDNREDTSECGTFIIIDESDYKKIDNTSAIFMDSMTIEGNCLSMLLGYSGCNNGHDMDMVTDGFVLESYPVQIHFKIRDNLPQDCEAYFTETYSFDLSPLSDFLQTEDKARIIFQDQQKEILWER